MKPAPSIIGFTTISGLGYGMLVVLAAGALFGIIPMERWLGVTGLLLALGAITTGLLSSTLHLGHPERAWRAITQWRSSWLSREGVLALVTFIPALLFAAGWILSGSVAGVHGLMAAATAIGAIATVYCTGMIYASLPPIKAWHQPLTAPIYLAFAFMTGLLAVHFLLILFGAPHFLIGILTIFATGVAFLLKIFYWRNAARARADGPTTAEATGLGTSELVRMLDPPHTQTNYLLDEMGFQIGRKHASLLRGFTLLFGLILPIVLTIIALTPDSWATTPLAFLAFASGLIGVLIERWLFFAEAEHTVMLFYGGRRPEGASPKRVPAKEIAPSASAMAKRRRATPTRRRPVIRSGEGEIGDQPSSA
ncbi:MAG: dimethyl sulfoxide reductase anchor subunit family protein [Geminicoccaceae bacterium]